MSQRIQKSIKKTTESKVRLIRLISASRNEDKGIATHWWLEQQ